jgi:hypothetical protein
VNASEQAAYDPPVTVPSRPHIARLLLLAMRGPEPRSEHGSKEAAQSDSEALMEFTRHKYTFIPNANKPRLNRELLCRWCRA